MSLRHEAETSLRHEAVFYKGFDEFVDRMTPFIREGVRACEPILVLVSPDKSDALKSSLGPDADAVVFGNMTEIGRNPARILPVWEDFIGKSTGPARGIGEPIWQGRSPDELVEAQRHEELINVAFKDTAAWVVCPYDTTILDESVIAEAHRSHPIVSSNGTTGESSIYPGFDSFLSTFDKPLSPAAGPVSELTVSAGNLRQARTFLAREGAAMGLSPSRVDEFVLAMNELVSNSIRHAAGSGLMSVWSDPSWVLGEVRDQGFIADPLVGRRLISDDKEGSRGLWIANQLCDLVEIRTGPNGSVVRIRMARS